MLDIKINFHIIPFELNCWPWKFSALFFHIIMVFANKKKKAKMTVIVKIMSMGVSKVFSFRSNTTSGRNLLDYAIIEKHETINVPHPRWQLNGNAEIYTWLHVIVMGQMENWWWKLMVVCRWPLTCFKVNNWGWKQKICEKGEMKVKGSKHLCFTREKLGDNW